MLYQKTNSEQMEAQSKQQMLGQHLIDGTQTALVEAG